MRADTPRIEELEPDNERREERGGDERAKRAEKRQREPRAVHDVAQGERTANREGGEDDPRPRFLATVAAPA